MTDAAAVLLYGEHVGNLTDDGRGRFEFQFFDSYCGRGVSRPVLSQSFEDDLQRRYRGPSPGALPTFFANFLPEGRLRDFLAAKHHLDAGDDFSLLLLIGRDLPGAIQVVDLPEGYEAGVGDGSPEITHVQSKKESDSEIAYKFSLAGVQLKFSALFDEEKATLTAKENGVPVIVKLHGESLQGLSENEWSMMEWARLGGLDAAEVRLVDIPALGELPFGNSETVGRALVVSRFDRDMQGKIHQEDFAQAMGVRPALKYEHRTYEDLAVIASASTVHAWETLKEFIRRLTFVIASGNADAHQKNWSLLYQEPTMASLAPIYDQVFTGPYAPKIGPVGGPEHKRRPRNEELALKLASTKSFGELSISHLEEFARRVLCRLEGAGFAVDPSYCERVSEVVESLLVRLLKGWKNESERWPMLAQHKELLETHWASVPLLRDMGEL